MNSAVISAGIALAGIFLGTYVLLLATFFVTGLIISKLNQTMSEQKIQKNRVLAPQQVRRDLKQSIISLAWISLFFSLGSWFYYHFGWGFVVQKMTITNTVLSFMGSMLIFDTWFYWLHRLLHKKPFYKKIHQWHHLTRTPVVWSNNSDTFLDNLFLQSYWMLAHFILPISPVTLLVHKIYDQITGVIGHSGHEYAGKISLPPSPLASVTHHDQHHEFFQCNYSTHFTFWDRLMGTLHPSHDTKVRQNIKQ